VDEAQGVEDSVPHAHGQSGDVQKAAVGLTAAVVYVNTGCLLRLPWLAWSFQQRLGVRRQDDACHVAIGTCYYTRITFGPYSYSCVRSTPALSFCYWAVWTGGR